MPTYQITIPGQGTFEVSSPTPLTDQQAYQAVAQQTQGRSMTTDPEMTFLSTPTASAEVPVPEAGIRERLAATGAQPRVAPTPSMGLRAESLGKGLLIDPIAAVAQVVGGEETRQRIAQREEEFQQKREREGSVGTDWFRLIGNVGASILPGTAGAKAVQVAGGGRILQGVGAGAAGGAVMPVTQTVAEAADPDQFALQKLKDVGFSGAVGGVVSKIGAALTPELREGVREQLEAGVRVPAGQAYGGVPGWFFRQMESIGFGPSERAIRNSFTRSAAEEVLDGVQDVATGAAITIPKNIKDGMQLSGWLQKTLEKYYNDAFKKIGEVIPDQGFADDLKKVAEANVPNMSQGAQNIFKNSLKKEIIDQFSLGSVPTGAVAPMGMKQIPSMNGEKLKNINNFLKSMVEKYGKGTDSDSIALASGYEDALNAFRSYTSRADPTGLLAQGDEAWAKLYRFADAAKTTKPVQQFSGSFSPAELAAAANRQATTLQAGAGAGPMGEFARRGVGVLGGEPDVLSAGYRQAVIGGKVLAAGGIAGGSLYLFSPLIAVPLLVAAGMSNATARALMKNPGATRIAVEKAIQKLGPQAVGAILAREEAKPATVE
jgi:hypothetical protein